MMVAPIGPGSMLFSKRVELTTTGGKVLSEDCCARAEALPSKDKVAPSANGMPRRALRIAKKGIMMSFSKRQPCSASPRNEFNGSCGRVSKTPNEPCHSTQAGFDPFLRNSPSALLPPILVGIRVCKSDHVTFPCKLHSGIETWPYGLAIRLLTVAGAAHARAGTVTGSNTHRVSRLTARQKGARAPER